METSLKVWRDGKIVDYSTVQIEWSDEKLGFGEISLVFMNGRYFLDSDSFLNKTEVKKILNDLIDQMEFTDGTK
jgi:hypothetical protein